MILRSKDIIFCISFRYILKINQTFPNDAGICTALHNIFINILLCIDQKARHKIKITVECSLPN